VHSETGVKTKTNPQDQGLEGLSWSTDDNISAHYHHRRHRRQPHHLELLVKFEGQADDVSSTVKSLKQLSAVDELTVVGERMPTSKGMHRTFV